MPIDLRRRDDIVAAVAAYDSAHPSAPLPRNAARLLAVMFPRGRVPTQPGGHRCAKDSPEEAPRLLRRLVEAGFLSRQPGRASRPTPTACICRRCSHEAAAARRCSAPAAPCRWTATPRPALRPTRAPGAAGTASRANTRARSPAPSWTCCRRCCGASTTPAPACCFPSYEAIADKAECARSTVAEALKVLEWAGVLTWQHRITRILVRCSATCSATWAERWRVIRTSNAYVFSDPKAAVSGGFASKSENPTGTPESRGSISTGTSPRPEQPAGTRPGPVRRGTRRAKTASNKAAAGRPEPQNPAQERT